MQGKSIFGGIRSTACLGEILLILNLYINDTREKDAIGAIEQFFDLGLAAAVKTWIHMASTFFPSF